MNFNEHLSDIKQRGAHTQTAALRSDHWVEVLAAGSSSHYFGD